jgi:hypothetical protein
LIVIVLVALLVAVLIRSHIRTRHRDNAFTRIQLLLEEIDSENWFPVGIVVAGMEGATRLATGCSVGSDDLVFFPDLTTTGKNPGNPELPVEELGRISRNAVESLAVRDLTQTQKHIQTVQRLSATRMVFLGPFSLAAPKRKKIESTTTIPKFYLTLDWADPNGIGQQTVFEFAEGDEANFAENKIRHGLKPKARNVRSNEKQCPDCAEYVKAAARKCRFCGSDLTRVDS